MSDPFTIHIFVSEGDPDGVLIISRLNWTGMGVVFPRDKWPEIRQKQKEMLLPGIYILRGFRPNEDDDLPTLYVGQAENISIRINEHFNNLDFWDWGAVFVSTSKGLNKAWLEYALIKRAKAVQRCHLYNSNAPAEPALPPYEKADMEGFLKEIIQILPLLNLHAFEYPKKIKPEKIKPEKIKTGGEAGERKRPPPPPTDRNTIIVPAHEDGFKRVFLGENCWYAVRIARKNLKKINYVAAYVTSPVRQITHYAEVKQIEPYGETHKYKLVFAGKPQQVGPIAYGDARPVDVKHPFYTTFDKLKSAKQLTDLMEKVS
jgi:hypothetical protein